MPTPGNKETKPEFIDRCMAQLVGQEGKETDQAYAICQSKWSDHKFNKIKEYFSGISFDYDGVLSTDKGKELARSSNGAKYIISARSDKQGMESVAKELGISLNHVYATGSNKAKIEKIKELGISTHYDNNPDVVNELGSKGKLFND